MTKYVQVSSSLLKRNYTDKNFHNRENERKKNNINFYRRITKNVYLFEKSLKKFIIINKYN